MSKETMTQPVVGVGSPVGKRYFVSKYPSLSITMKPADIIISDNGKERPQKAKRILFMKQMKPARFKGTGMLGRSNHDGGDGSDRNDSHYWGVFVTEDQEIIDWLRQHEYYRTTRQDNTLEREMKLKELDFDPRHIPVGDNGMVRLRTPKDLSSEPETAPEAPVEGAAALPKAKVSIRKS